MSVRSSGWIATKRLNLKEIRTKELSSGSFRMRISPYAIPVALRVNDDSDLRARTLEILYLGEEPISSGKYKDGIEIEYGRRSMRPTRISINYDSDDAVKDFPQRVKAALDSFRRVNTNAEQHPKDFLAKRGRLAFSVDYIKKSVDDLSVELGDLRLSDSG